MTHEERKKLYAALAAPFPEEAIERTDGRVTGRGYSTTGIRCQYIVNRLNDVLGVGGFRVERMTAVRQVTTAKGRDAFEATCDLRLQLGQWQDGAFTPFAEAVADGGHTAMTEADARKGAASNALKKAAAFFGVGRQAYEGSIDDDNVPVEQPAPKPQPAQPAEPAAATPPRTATPRVVALPERNRLTSKQLNALWAIARNQGYAEPEFRSYCVEAFGCQPEFLTRAFASQIIDQLGRGAKDHADRHPGQEG